jgi:hypothetical protein
MNGNSRTKTNQCGEARADVITRRLRCGSELGLHEHFGETTTLREN